MRRYHKLNSFEHTFQLKGPMLKTMQKVMHDNPHKIMQSIIFQENNLVLSFSDYDHYHISFLGEIAYTSEKLDTSKL